MPVSPLDGAANNGNGVPFLVSAGIVYEIIAAACSSPQTAEINADKRAETLMKWVYIGTGQAVVFVGIAMAVDRKHSYAILAGGGLAATFMLVSYRHAKVSGLANPGPGTET